MSGEARYEGLLTDEILGRAIAELESVHGDLIGPGDPSHDGVWLSECERRVGNALEDVAYVRDAFKLAQS